MVIFICITLSLIVIHFVYILYLYCLPAIKNNNVGKTSIENVSLVLFSYNNKQYLEDKIISLITELARFEKHELIVIDYNSTDGSKEELEILKTRYGINVMHYGVKGVASAINMGVQVAKFDFVIFCDLRQKISENILVNLVEPFINPEIGAVSSCLSSVDSDGKKSLLRTYENFIKSLESKKGKLIGVYGPLYAIRKQCFVKIPNDTILEDLHLSLSILKSHHIIMCRNCLITDISFSKVYNYKRVRRYFKGLIQIAFENNIFRNLGFNQKLMLVCHKFLRLIIPVMSFISMFFLCIMLFNSNEIPFSFTFISAVLICLVFILIWLKNILLVYCYYLFAFFEILVLKLFYNKT